LTDYPWLRNTSQQLVGLGSRLPHAMLFVGPAGLGKRALAEAFAAHLLCQAPAADGVACGVCSGCRLRQGGNHPDLFRLEPATATKVDESDTKRASSQIVIEQVRTLQQSLSVTGHQSARRVVIVDPADAMNVFTANALLKLLEEPPVGCVLVLVSSSPRQLLPTIRSRCQQWHFTPPTPAQAQQWLAAQSPDAVDLMAVCGGMPLAAEHLAQQGMGPCLSRFQRDVVAMASSEPVALAGEWDKWLKSKEAVAAGLDLQRLVDWMFRWVCDVAAVAMRGRIRYFPQCVEQLERVAREVAPARGAACYNELMRIHQVVQHPLNTRLVLEDMLLRYARAVNGARQ